MKKLGIVLFLTAFCMLAAMLPSPVVAQAETIALEATYPSIESATPGGGFKFTVALKYQGSQARVFDLRVAGPSGWTTYVTSVDESVKITAINLQPGRYYPDQVKVIASPPASPVPEPREYVITLQASSGTITDRIELVAKVMPTYSLEWVLSPGFDYRNVTAGGDNPFSVNIKNTGSGTLTNIRFSAAKAEDLVIEFKPGAIDSLAPGSSGKVGINIKPAVKDAAGYYQVTMIAEADQTRVTTNMQVFAEKPRGSWIWVGAGIAVLLIVGFIVVFLRVSRRD